MPEPETKKIPIAYFITFTTYGSWVPGDSRGFVDRDNNAYGTPPRESQFGLSHQAFQSLSHPPVELSAPAREQVLEALLETAGYRGWYMWAAHARVQHIHTVVEANASAEKVLNDFKAYATRRLRKHELLGADQNAWTERGSKRYIWTPDDLERVVLYTLFEQGEPMAIHDGRNRPGR